MSVFKGIIVGWSASIYFFESDVLFLDSSAVAGYLPDSV